MSAYDRIGAQAAAARDEAACAALLDAVDTALEAIEVRGRSIMWDRYHGQLDGDLDAVSRERGAILLEPRLAATLDDWADRAADPGTRRRITQLRGAIGLARVNEQPSVFERRNALDAQIVAWRPVVGDQTVERSTATNILTRDDNRERRRQAFAANAPLSKRIEGEMWALFQARNAAARAEGYPDYAELVLTEEGLSKRWVRELFDELDRLTDAPYRAALERGASDLGIGQPEMWDLAFAFRRLGAPPDALFPVDGIIPAVNALARGFGIEPERLPIQIVYRDIPFGGLCMPIRVPDDVRILCNPRDGHNYYQMMFHEYGHALHAALNSQLSFSLKREPPPFNEGMAQTWGYFAHDPDWLREQTPLSEAAVAAFRDRTASWLYHLRSLMAIASWELAAYEEPDQDLDALRAQHESRYLLVPAPEVPRWATDSWLTMYPVYVQNYVIADVIASQTHRALRRRFGRLMANPGVVPVLRDGYWAPAGSIDWREKVELVTGEPINSRALAADLSDTRIDVPRP